VNETKDYLLTTPEEIKQLSSLLLTGNQYVSLPEISPRRAGIISINLVLYGYLGLIEFCGSNQSPLLQPLVKIEGKTLPLEGKLAWSYYHYWIPQFSYYSPRWQLEIKGQILAPPGHRGFMFSIKLINHSGIKRNITWGWKGCWKRTYHTIFNRRPLQRDQELYYQPWTDSLLLECRGGQPAGALALSPYPKTNWKHMVRNLGSNSSQQKFSWYRQESLMPYGQCSATLFAGVNLEGDGAATTAMDLKRRGHCLLENESISWLEERQYDIEDSSLKKVFQRNLFFSYFFSLGRTVDNDHLVALTSRSPRYYVSAAFWSRDTLLWSFPGILLVNRDTAREVLITVFSRHLKRAGEHAHYLNGVLLYPGFELDQLASHFLALRLYLDHTGDYSILMEKCIKEGLDLLAAKVDRWFDAKTGLYMTFLDPSDDPVEPYPLLVYDNALLQQGFSFLDQLQRKKIWEHPDDFGQKARRLKEAILEQGVVEGPYGPMFAWAVNSKGGHRLYDNPPGSLQLLAHYGYCPFDYPVYRNTVRWIRSRHNPYYHGENKVKEPGSLHAVHPWPLSAANDLLSLNWNRGNLFKLAEMDNGFCCETIKPETGKAATGLAFASAAGFLAYAIWKKGAQKKTD